ncbi:MAG: hypothetical protein JRI68_35395, partial [Deltaproteobacteria bacterium]|nr:hypothetical protein [Deltaproteobacteria bacterium]
MSSPPPESTDPPEADRSDDPGQTAPGTSEAALRRARQRLRRAERLLHLGIFTQRTLRWETPSARLVAKALRMMLRAIVELETPAPVADESDGALLARVTELNSERRWFRHSPEDDFGLIHRLAEGFDQDDFEPPRADQRRYRRSLRRLPRTFHEAIAQVQHRHRRLPAVRARRRRRLFLGLLLGGAVVGGLASYRYVQAQRCITGQYFAGRDHDQLVFERRDCAIDFDWDIGSPGSGVGADDFSVRWEGVLEIEEAGFYTFELRSDDGSRLVVDGKPVIDHWSDHGFAPLQGSIRLPAGRAPFRVEYYERDDLAAVRWSWRKDG